MVRLVLRAVAIGAVLLALGGAKLSAGHDDIDAAYIQSREGPSAALRGPGNGIIYAPSVPTVYLISDFAIRETGGFPITY